VALVARLLLNGQHVNLSASATRCDRCADRGSASGRWSSEWASSDGAALCDGRVAADIPRAFGGGEVVLELTIDSEGSVAEVKRVRMTPPYLDFVVKSVTPWRFTPATAVLDGRVTTVAAPVLVVAVFRPPLVYAGPAPGPRTQVLGSLSRRVPSVESVALPAYPPMAIGDGVVVVEIEMRRGEPLNFRIVGPASGFDAAALDAVRSWRFGPPQDSDVPDTIFAYAMLGFRGLLTPPAERPR
jgi:TonB family protein